MKPFRFLVLKQPMLALAVGLAALLLRLAVPAGFMPVAEGGYALAPCPAAGAQPMPGHGDGGQAERGCAFADLSLPAVGGAGAAFGAATPVFALAPALFAGTVIPARTPLRLRPPLRGPPLPR